MMQQTKTLSKILNVREKEKKDAQIAHHESMTFFNKKNSKLVSVIQKKKTAEELYNEALKKITTIEKVREQVEYIDLLNKEIFFLQTEVTKAKESMENKQNMLTEAHVEVKKFEKIIGIREYEQKKQLQKSEQIMMDEISAQQYLTRKLGE